MGVAATLPELSEWTLVMFAAYSLSSNAAKNIYPSEIAEETKFKETPLDRCSCICLYSVIFLYFFLKHLHIN